MTICKGVAPILGAVSRSVIVVKMQSKGQGTSWGLVKSSSGFWALSPALAVLAVKRCDQQFEHAQLIYGQRVKGQVAVVKAIFGWSKINFSKILTAVTALDA